MEATLFERTRKAVYIKDLDLVYVPINKNASSTICRLLHDRWGGAKGSYKGVPYPDIHKVASKAVAMFRDPVQRAISGYWFLKNNHSHMPTNQRFPDLNLNLEEFIEACLYIPPRALDPHIAPQYLHLHAPIEHDLVAWDFERLAEIFDLGEITHRNPGKYETPTLSDKCMANLYQLYYPDFRIWEQLRK